ncbi:Conserved_hypothetical protein [Hexamita inflata]|uniref:Uncharacterized protein n=1 Tax=Hexamita inflata TaxID=28002 RepID=A0AA86NBF4_9EUKA|nr:Conserved hypothetical protein [Hexamita inflata]
MDHLFEDDEVEVLLTWLHIFRAYRHNENTRLEVLKFQDTAAKFQDHLRLDKNGAPFFKICLVSAPLGSGLTTLLKWICQVFKRECVIKDAMQFQLSEDITKLQRDINETNRLFKNAKIKQIIIENVENMSQRLLSNLSHVKAEKPLIITTTDPFGQGMRQLRSNCLFIQLQPSYAKVSAILENQITRQDFIYHNQNFGFIKNNLDTLKQINQPQVNNIVIGCLLRIPEILLNVFNMQRFQAQQFLIKLGFDQPYASPHQFLQLMNKMQFETNIMRNKIIQNIFNLSCMKDTLVQEYESQEFDNQWDLNQCGLVGSRIYSQYAMDLSDASEYGYDAVLPEYQLLENLSHTVLMSAPNQQKLASQIQYSQFSNDGYLIQQEHKVLNDLQSQTKLLQQNFFYEFLPISKQIIYFGASKVLSIETITDDEKEKFAQSAVILDEIGLTAEQLFPKKEEDNKVDIMHKQNQQKPKYGSKEQTEMIRKNSINEHLYQYVDEGVSLNVQRLLNQYRQKISGFKQEDAVQKILGIIGETEKVNEQVEYTYNVGVTLAIRVVARMNDFF